jgi:hypothetical protein
MIAPCRRVRQMAGGGVSCYAGSSRTPCGAP